MTDFKYIYAHEAQRYDRMVGREDQRGHLMASLMEMVPFDTEETVVVDFGAGTGRITRLMTLLAKRVYGFDIAPTMIATAHNALEESGMTNWRVGVGDNHAMPLPNACANVVIEGWSFGHAMSWAGENWQADVTTMLNEMRRLLKPNGTAILIETLGTGNKQPHPPTEDLAMLYRWWEEEHGFAHRWIRTDYQFESVQEADDLTRFFFGDELADKLVQEGATLLPECTGIWWRTF